jgi:hypothetical protein
MTTAGPPGLRPAGHPGVRLLAVVPWDAATKEAFLRMQFAAQDSYYHANFPSASYDLIVSGAAKPVQMHVERFNPARRLYDCCSSARPGWARIR